jgi:hypothetical protein
VAADSNSLAACMTTPETLDGRPVSRLTPEEQEQLGLLDLCAATNEAQRLQMLQRLVVKLSVHGLSPFEVQHELAACNFDINLLRIKAILDNPLARAEIRQAQRQAGVAETEEEALQAAAPDCIRLLHEVVKYPYSVLDDPNGGQGKVVPLLMSDRLFAAKQLLDRYNKTAPVSHRRTVHENKGLVGQDDLAQMKALHSKALLNEATGVEGD